MQFNKNFLVLLVVVFALAVVAPFASANHGTFGHITSIEVNGIEVLGGSIDLANFAGDRVSVRIRFDAATDATDARIKAWISGESENSAVSERFEVLTNRTYVKTLLVDLPSDLNENLNEGRSLEIAVENRDETADRKSIGFTVQRESYLLEILGINIPAEVKSGELLPIDVVLKNIGSRLAEDTFLKVSIPELGLESSTFYGDLSAIDQDNPDRSDSVERRTFLRIPMNAPAGLYTVKIEAANSDSFAATERRVLVVGAGKDTRVVSAITSKTLAVGEKGEFQLTLVNTGDVVRIYQVMVDAPSALNIQLSDSLVVVPAGSSRTVSLFVEGSQKGSQSFNVKINSDTGELLDSKTFRADIEESKTGAIRAPQNTTVLLTVVLAIIFVVLLVVLIVLLTRKPETKEELGESYY